DDFSPRNRNLTAGEADAVDEAETLREVARRWPVLPLVGIANADRGQSHALQRAAVSILAVPGVDGSLIGLRREALLELLPRDFHLQVNALQAVGHAGAAQGDG